MCAAEEAEDEKTGDLLGGFKVVNFENMEEEELERTEGSCNSVVWAVQKKTNENYGSLLVHLLMKKRIASSIASFSMPFSSL